MWLVCCKGFEDYLPMAVNAIGVLSADIVSSYCKDGSSQRVVSDWKYSEYPENVVSLL